MAKQVLGPLTKVEINGTDLSAWCTSVTLEDSADEVESTGMGQTYRSFLTGLKDATVTTTFHQDYAGSAVDEIIGGIYYGTTVGTVKVTADTGVQAAGGTCVYTLQSRPFGWSPIGGGLGDINSIDVTWRNMGTVGLQRGTV